LQGCQLLHNRLLSLTPQELLDHMAEAGVPRDHMQVRGQCLVIKRKDGVAVAIESDTARVTFPPDPPTPSATTPASAKRKT
jgi:hypothetical protein